MYETIAVAAIGGGGPFDEDGGGTLRGTISDRLGNNMVFLALTIMVVATIGWAAPLRPAACSAPHPQFPAP